MKILLDECMPRKLKASLAGHECFIVPEAGLAGRRNGELLSLAEQRGFEIFLTLDKGIAYQQNLAQSRIAILVIRASSNRLVDLGPHVSACLAKIELIRPGELVMVGGS